jgi:hypothetical protein
MAVEVTNGATIITGEHVQLYALLALKSALNLEIKGLRMSRGISAYATAKTRYGFKGNKQKVLAQLEALIAARFPQSN